MTKMFGNLKTDGLEETEDRVGGGFEPAPSDVYDAVIKLAYVENSPQSKSQAVMVIADIGGKELRESLRITNREGENFYRDKDDSSKKHPLPGFTTADDLCLFATEKDLADQDAETKVVKIYNFDERKEVPTEVPVLVDLIGKTVKLAVLRVIDNKRKKDDSGNYVNTDETRTFNEIDKVLHPDTRRTINEYKRGIEQPEFYEAWIERNQNKDRNKAKGAGNGAGSSGSGKPGFAGGSAKKSIFNKS